LVLTKDSLNYKLLLMKRVFFALILGFFIVLLSCRSLEPKEEFIETTEPSIILEEKEPEPVQQEEAPPIPEEIPEPPKEEPLTEEPVLEENKEEEPIFTVTEELYTKTFLDIELFIDNLNKIILSQDYNTWLSFLTDEYKARYNDPVVLNQISEEPKLKRYNIRLRNLRDYFNYVVVSSRQNVRLDDIVFVDVTHIKALTIIDGVPYLLYLLENINGEWKIGVW